MVKRILILCVCSIAAIANAAEYVDVNSLHAPSYRVGTSEIPK